MGFAAQYKQLEVELGKKSYPIKIGSGVSIHLNQLKDQLIAERRKIAALVDNGLANANHAFLNNFLSDVPFLNVPAGEDSKCVEWLNKGWDFLASNKIDRTGVLFVFGGGVTGDLGGFWLQFIFES